MGGDNHGVELDLTFFWTGLATLLYQVGRALSWLGHRLSGTKPEPEPDPKSPEGVVVGGANRVLELFEAHQLIEYQIYCKAEKRAKRAAASYDQWFLARHIPVPFRQDEDVKWGDILALTAGGHYNRDLLAEAAKLDAVTIANYLMLDRAGLLKKGTAEEKLDR
jgi:hypothetical protein